MKFTKKEQKYLKWYFDDIKALLKINKIYEDKNIIPKYVKINLIKYGIKVGRIIEIIHRHIDLKNDDKNLNSDSIIKELFGIDFFNWLSIENKKFIYGNDDKINNKYNIYNNTSDNQHNKE